MSAKYSDLSGYFQYQGRQFADKCTNCSPWPGRGGLRPGRGDFMRTIGADPDNIGGFNESNRSKRSFGVNLRKDKGRELVTSLIKMTDIIGEKVTAEQAHPVLTELAGPDDAAQVYAVHVGFVRHGRRICHARRPACGECPLAGICPSAGLV